MTHPTATCSEHELVAAVRRGDDRAFETLYSRYRSRISSYIFGMVGDHGRAEDIAQEVFISALRRMRDTERPIAFKPWLYEIAKNACIDEFRRTRRTREVPLESEDDDGGRELQSNSPTPDAAIQNKQSLSDLRGAFHGLSESHHRLIVMRELEGLSYEQIGDRMGMSKPMVESSLFRARRKLTEEYEELVSGRRCEHVQTLIAGEQRRSLLKLGVRERRQLARHLAHCQPCRREARMAGLDEAFFKAPKTLAGKIAALLPIPWIRRWRSSGSGDDAVAASTPHSVGSLQGLQKMATMVDPAGPTVGLGRAAAAVAAIAAAGIGGGVVTGTVGSQSPSKPRPAIRSAASYGPATRVSKASSHKRTGYGVLAKTAAHKAHRHHATGGTGGTSSTGNAQTSTGSSSGSTGQTASGVVAGATGGATGTVNNVTGGHTTAGGGSGTKTGVSLPTVTVPTLTVPTLTVPQLTVPTVSVPSVTLP